VCGDLQKEPAVASGVDRLTVRGTAKRDTAKDKGSGMVSEFLMILIPLLSDELDGLQVFEPALGDSDGRQYGPERGKRDISDDVGRRTPPFDRSGWRRVEVFQKCSKSLRN
jgi:hypothetical protein